VSTERATLRLLTEGSATTRALERWQAMLEHCRRQAPQKNEWHLNGAERRHERNGHEA